jgi:hypothetical protein
MTFNAAFLVAFSFLLFYFFFLFWGAHLELAWQQTSTYLGVQTELVG